MLSKLGTLLALCVAAASQQLQSVTAVDYLGRWLPRQQCVGICDNSQAAPFCINNDADCLTKKQRPRNYDYLLLEQIFIPKYCRDLLKGTDSTISHQNVNAYPTAAT